jgi:hypothetical protein
MYHKRPELRAAILLFIGPLFRMDPLQRGRCFVNTSRLLMAVQESATISIKQAFMSGIQRVAISPLLNSRD